MNRNIKMLKSHSKTLPKITPIPFLFLLCVLSILPTPVKVCAASHVEIIYTGNEGFLIVAEGKKVLIDAFHRLGQARNQEMLENGQPPFDDVDLILTTHTDHDHFDLHMAGQYLVKYPNTHFVSTKQATDAFEKYFPDVEKIKARLKGFAPREGERISFSHEGIDITMMLLQHGRNREVKVTNLGFLFSIGGKKIFHMGDSEIIHSELNIYDLPEENIDVAFVPYWYFTSEKYKPALLQNIGAKQVIAMHLILVGGGPQERREILESIHEEFPEAILFSEEMEKRIIR
jgi:L-ascorbate metabolism protein UlaG (beta-lactamase superfamily)